MGKKRLHVICSGLEVLAQFTGNGESQSHNSGDKLDNGIFSRKILYFIFFIVGFHLDFVYNIFCFLVYFVSWLCVCVSFTFV